MFIDRKLCELDGSSTGERDCSIDEMMVVSTLLI